MSLYELIRDMHIFDEFTEDEKQMVAKMNHSVFEFKQGDRITQEGETSTALYLIVKGSVMVTKTRDNAKIRIAKLGPGEIFGEMSFFAKKTRHSDVTANEDVTVVQMDDKFFKKANPAVRDKIKNYFIELLINRLDVMNESIMRISKLMRM